MSTRGVRKVYGYAPAVSLSEGEFWMVGVDQRGAVMMAFIFVKALGKNIRVVAK
jgi:hypothetical protein